jgi:peroxiredoxin
VLVDFWASWCGPCRRENPNVVQAFNQFKNKNFTILGVSLDRPGQKENWIKAIKEDNLTWTHISDLKFWQSEVVPVYQVGSIPFNVLVDPDGKVVAENLRGNALEQKLHELLNESYLSIRKGLPLATLFSFLMWELFFIICHQGIQVIISSQRLAIYSLVSPGAFAATDPFAGIV